MNAVVVHYKELALKGRNRPWFVQRLVRNLRLALGDMDVTAVRALMGRIEIEVGRTADWDELRDRVRRVFGIANFSHAGRASHDLDEIAAAILRDLGDVQPATFRVSARRADKSFALTSPQIEREVGGRIKTTRGWTVSAGLDRSTCHPRADLIRPPTSRSICGEVIGNRLSLRFADTRKLGVSRPPRSAMIAPAIASMSGAV